MHRGYNKDLPAFLVNRPRFFVEHCKQKIKLASNIDKTGIKTTDFPGVFEVKSESLSKTWYRVQFGSNDGERPSCECRAWQRSRLLCKHFFAVFNHHPEWNWENLPKEYWESPFITLDYHLLNGTGSPTQPSCTASPEVIQCRLQSDEPLSKRLRCSSENDPFIPQAPIPTKSKQLKQSDGRKCCHLLDQLRELTLVVQDPGALASLHENLSTQLAKMQQCKPSEDGLVLEGGDSKSYTRTNQKTRSKTLTAVGKKCRAELPKRSTKTKTPDEWEKMLL